MNWDYYESVQRFHRILDAQGISEALKEEGAQEGDLVMIGEWTPLHPGLYLLICCLPTPLMAVRSAAAPYLKALGPPPCYLNSPPPLAPLPSRTLYYRPSSHLLPRIVELS